MKKINRSQQRRSSRQILGKAAPLHTNTPSTPEVLQTTAINEVNYSSTTSAKWRTKTKSAPPLDSLQSLTAVSSQLDTLERNRNKSADIHDPILKAIFSPTAREQRSLTSKKLKFTNPRTSIPIPNSSIPTSRNGNAERSQNKAPFLDNTQTKKGKPTNPTKIHPPGRPNHHSPPSDKSITDLFYRLQQDSLHFQNSIKIYKSRLSDPDSFHLINELSLQADVINNSLSRTKEIVLEFATGTAVEAPADHCQTREEVENSNTFSEMDQTENMDSFIDADQNEEVKQDENERYCSSPQPDVNPIQKINFSPQKFLSPKKLRPSKTCKSGEDSNQSNWRPYTEYDEIIQAIESDETISGTLRTALISMAKMNSDTQKSVSNIYEGQVEMSKRIDENAKKAEDGHMATQNLLRELLGKGDDPAKKHPRSENHPSKSSTDQPHALSFSSIIAKPPSHFQQPSPPTSFQQNEFYKIPHLFLSSRFLSTRPHQQKYMNPNMLYILPKRTEEKFKMDPHTFRHINSVIVQTCRKIRIAPPTRIAPLKSGNKIIVAMHRPSDIPTLLQSLTLPQDFFASEYITPPQPVKLLLNGLSDPQLGPANIVKTILLCNREALPKLDHTDLTYVKHNRCRKQTEFGQNKYNITFLASPRFIRLLSDMESSVYIRNEKYNMSDCTTNFFCTNCCSLDHLATFCQSKPRCSICADPGHCFADCPMKEEFNIPNSRRFCSNCEVSEHSARDFDSCPAYKTALMRRYGNLNWLDQNKHEKFANLNGILSDGPQTPNPGTSLNFDGELISADLPPDIIDLVHEST